MIHHGPARQPRGARGGVAIILSSLLTKGWMKGGNMIKREGKTMVSTTKLLRLDIKLRVINTNLKISKKIKTKKSWKIISILSNYHPTTGYKPKEIEKHISNVMDFLNDIPLNHEVIIGAALNAAIGIRDS